MAQSLGARKLVESRLRPAIDRSSWFQVVPCSSYLLRPSLPDALAASWATMAAPNDAQEIASFLETKAVDESCPAIATFCFPHFEAPHTQNIWGSPGLWRNSSPTPLLAYTTSTIPGLLELCSMRPRSREKKLRIQRPWITEIQDKARSVAVGCALACVDSRDYHNLGRPRGL
ncbi:hypothetical protein FZEAL_4336 [Fusarium zealandicum]|uniref:Uncharacterized protein n=1 Tax=Fusarium zealandicum TaxID=1053134 RepID=A0A8H4UMG9_9HYPO|nr:hypothetical protein FZEAL_4336 [Fusarium zealandicum]